MKLRIIANALSPLVLRLPWEMQCQPRARQPRPQGGRWIRVSLDLVLLNEVIECSLKPFRSICISRVICFNRDYRNVTFRKQVAI